MAWNPNIGSSQNIFQTQGNPIASSSAKASSLPIDPKQIINNQSEILKNTLHEYSATLEKNTTTLEKTRKFTPNQTFNTRSVAQSHSENSNLIAGKSKLSLEAEGAYASLLKNPFTRDELCRLNLKSKILMESSLENMNDPNCITVGVRNKHIFSSEKLPEGLMRRRDDGQLEAIPPENIIIVSKEEFESFSRDALDELLRSAPKTEVHDVVTEKDRHHHQPVNIFKEHPVQENVLLKKQEEMKEEKEAQQKTEVRKAIQKSGIRRETAKRKQITTRRKKEEQDKANLKVEKAKTEKTREAHLDPH